MSITGALNNALSGLAAASRAAEIVASNTANATTPGYAKRGLALSAADLGGRGAGVRIDGVTRQVNDSLLGDLRLATASGGNARLLTGFHSDLEARIGAPGEAGSLSARLAGFESALIGAASQPDATLRLTQVLSAAQDVVQQVNGISAHLETVRTQADRQIATQVGVMNTTLAQIADLNRQIVAQRSLGQDGAALMDQRQVLVDKLAEIVPLRTVARDNDQIALFTTGGASLLEGHPAEIGFAPVGLATADMTLASGALSGLTLNGMPIDSKEGGVLGGGQLGALFTIRDDLAPDAQAQIDAFARDLIARFSDPAIDPSLSPGDAGLFTDRGAPFDPLEEVGLAGRLAINAAADPGQGGAVWRLRDGLNAAAAGDVGDPTLLVSLRAALTDSEPPASGAFAGLAKTPSGLAADILSMVSGARQGAAARESYANARQDALTGAFLAEGVDTDQELQKLLQIEQAYAANARVITTIDEMIQQLLRL